MSRLIEAEVRYLRAEWKGRAATPSIGDRASRHANTVKHRVCVNDARAHSDLHLDTSGFVLIDHETAVRDFHDAAELRETYHAEVVAVVQPLTGADATFVESHTIRTEETRAFNTAYARFVHCDYSLKGAADRSRRALERYRGSLDPTRQWAFAWYNTWQPIERAAHRNPLALIDARSLDPSDVLDYFYTGPKQGQQGRTRAGASPASMPIFNPRQRFCYFPRMRTDEMIVFKQLDTRRHRAACCPHTSIDVDAPADTPGRRSIEVRVACAFGS